MQSDLILYRVIRVTVSTKVNFQLLILLCFFGAIATLGSPHDITLQELRIEPFHTADEATADIARSVYLNMIVIPALYLKYGQAVATATEGSLQRGAGTALAGD